MSKKIIGIIIVLILILIYINPVYYFHYQFYININKPYTHFNQYLKNINLENTKKYKNIIFLYSHDYKTLPEYFNYSLSALQQYTQYHNYNIIIKNHYPNNSISPYWLRVYDINSLLYQYPENSTVIVYLDLDTLINLKFINVSISNLINQIEYYDDTYYDLFIGKDLSIDRYINTGAMFIKNTSYSKLLFKEWLTFYNPSNWIIKNNKWICSTNENENCIWAGYEYEQGALEYIYTTNILNSHSHIKILHTSICSTSIPFRNENIFIFHFMASSNEQRLETMKNLLK